MDHATFVASLSADAPAPGLPVLAEALWHDARGDWHAAHDIAQDESGPDAAWVHAYLHRKEGDEGNAGYWYRRADRPHCRDDLAAEWTAITTSLLGRLR